MKSWRRSVSEQSREKNRSYGPSIFFSCVIWSAYFKNENGPHITVSIGEVDGVKGKAYETGLLHFNEIKEPFMISGRLGYYIYGKGKIMDNTVFKKKDDDEISR